MKDTVLVMLLEAEGDYISGQLVSRELGISRAAVWKYIQALKNEGYIIEGVPHRGYRLAASPDFLYPVELQHGLSTCLIGKEIHRYEFLTSTNEEARRLADEGAREGTVVIAEKQTAGKGRMGRSWFSPPGGVWLSLILRPDFQPLRAAGITLMGAVACAEALRETEGVEARIKWPNDILVDGGKVCGILTEMKADMDRMEYIVMGLGINANIDPRELRTVSPGACSLSAVVGHTVDRKQLTRVVLEKLEKYYLLFPEDTGPVLGAWKKMTCTLGRAVTLLEGDRRYTGNARDITPDGGLVLDLDSGEAKVFYSGEVTSG